MIRFLGAGALVLLDGHAAAHEADHRVRAGTEHIKREILGDAMDPAEKAVSQVKEAGHNVAADVDKAKREIRDREDKK